MAAATATTADIATAPMHTHARGLDDAAFATPDLSANGSPPDSEASPLNGIPPGSPAPTESTNLTMTLDGVLMKHDDKRRIFGAREDEAEAEKIATLNQLLSRAASNGDAHKVTELIQVGRQWLDLDGHDEDGTTPLIYAACFGHIDVLYALLSAGANANAQDKSGWSALMWATSNNRDTIAKTLLDHGASTTVKSATGRTVMQYVKHAFTHDGGSNEKLLEVFSNPRGDGGLGFSWTGDMTAGGYYSPSSKRREIEESPEKVRQRAMESADQLDIDFDTLGFDQGENDEEEGFVEFDWNMCLPGQMFVFSPEDVPYIIETVVTKQKPACSREQRFTPANVIFLSARFAFYYSSFDLLEEILNLALASIADVVATRSREVPFLAFWMANCNQLLYYLKKDVGMVGATVEYQARLSELVTDVYESLVHDVELRLESVLIPSLLLHETISLDDVKFERDKSRSFIFGYVNSLPSNSTADLAGYDLASPGLVRVESYAAGDRARPLNSGFGHRRRYSSSRRSLRQQQPITPHSVTALLSSTLFILQTYHIHPTLIHYTLTQLFYSISAQVFNQLMTSKGLCSRSRAVQVRLNLLVLEEWVRRNHLPKSLFLHLHTVIQLLQFLQCMSQLQQVGEFKETLKDLDRLNAVQVRRATFLYRYEIGEKKMPNEIRHYLEQRAMEAKRRAAVASMADGAGDDDAHTAGSLPSVVDLDRDANGKLDEADVSELMDPRHMLPFSLPTVIEMDVGWGKRSAGEKGVITPTVPDDLVELLDNRTRQ